MQMEWDGWDHTPDLTHLSLVCSPVPSNAVDVLCLDNSTFTN